ncbi:transglycosylase domain-containing protein, partial [Acinetobacter baumannii]
EAILARRIEETLPKERILELYLNEIWLGYRSYGVAAAAFNYFGKPLNELSVAQMAYLACLPKGPDNYHPIRHRTLAIARRNWIIGEMAAQGW